jgi:hypothetical protein
MTFLAENEGASYEAEGEETLSDSFRGKERFQK